MIKFVQNFVIPADLSLGVIEAIKRTHRHKLIDAWADRIEPGKKYKISYREKIVKPKFSDVFFYQGVEYEFTLKVKEIKG